MTKIIGFAGKKQSGKNTCCNYIMAHRLKLAGVCDDACINEFGDILVSDIFGDKMPDAEWVPITDEFVDVNALYRDFSDCKIYALADPLKDIAINIFGLPRSKVYGSDEDKMSGTHLRWENMPGVVTTKLPCCFEQVEGKLGYYYTTGEYREDGLYIPIIYHEPGPMTIRDVLQFLGTEVFRRMSPNVWIETLLRRINEDNPRIALICDVRFDNEIEILKQRGAYVIGLKRNSKSKDKHASEQINFKLCSTVLDNQKMNLQEQCTAIAKMIKEV